MSSGSGRWRLGAGVPGTHFTSQAQPGGAWGFASPGALRPSFVLDTEQELGVTASHPPSPWAFSHLPLRRLSDCGHPEQECCFLSASAPWRLPLGGSKTLLKRQQPIFRRPPCTGETDRQAGRQMGDKARPVPVEGRHVGTPRERRAIRETTDAKVYTSERACWAGVCEHAC